MEEATSLLGALNVLLSFCLFVFLSFLSRHHINHLMEEASGLLGALNVKITQLLVVQRSPGPTVSLHADQVSGGREGTF